jgi:hypothetical protein
LKTKLKGDETLPRYLIERTFPDGLAIPADPQGAQACLTVVGNNSQDGVTLEKSSC